MKLKNNVSRTILSSSSLSESRPRRWFIIFSGCQDFFNLCLIVSVRGILMNLMTFTIKQRLSNESLILMSNPVVPPSRCWFQLGNQWIAS